MLTNGDGTLKLDPDIARLDAIIDNMSLMGMSGSEMIDFFRLAIIERTKEKTGNIRSASTKLSVTFGCGYKWYRI